MSEQEDKTPDQVADEDYKVAPTSADEAKIKKLQNDVPSKEQQTTGENYQTSADAKVEEEMREGVE
ncbi:MAG: hypothetical protein M3115_00500 [Thermoproteota archaeon]|nr:hypothetical protein [Thermoproteota archaeon]MDQ4100657.1 hypothetical protein [Thermoproteota archaeon]